MLKTYSIESDIPSVFRDYCTPLVERTWFEHPLFRQMLPFDVEPDLEAELYRLEADFADAVAAHELQRAFSMIATDTYCADYVLTYFEPNIPKTGQGDAIYWRLVFECVRNKASTFRQGDSLMKLLKSKRTRREEILCGDDYPEFENLTADLEVWRGVVASDSEDAAEMISNGLHWSLNRSDAEKFAVSGAYRVGKPFLAESVVSKVELIAYLPSKGEGEVLVWPNSRRSWNWISLGHVPPEW